jgi:hypothetical protein
MKFYDFNLSYNHWFEKELFFSSLGEKSKATGCFNILPLCIRISLLLIIIIQLN